MANQGFSIRVLMYDECPPYTIPRLASNTKKILQEAGTLRLDIDCVDGVEESLTEGTTLVEALSGDYQFFILNHGAAGFEDAFFWLTHYLDIGYLTIPDEKLFILGREPDDTRYSFIPMMNPTGYLIKDEAKAVVDRMRELL